MNRGLPPAILSPARADLFRGALAERTARVTLGDPGGLSLTVTIEDRPPDHGRRFAFRAARQTDPVSARQADHEPDFKQATPVTDQRPDANAVPDHPDAHSSAPFLAAAIAQAHPSPVLHNPPYREATVAYRRSDGLGVSGSTSAVRSDQKV